MTDAAPQVAPEAPAVPPVAIELGPDTKVYPDRLVPKPEPPTTTGTPPDSGQPAVSPPPTESAGPSEPGTQPTPPSSEGSRRQKGEDAYQRGVREGREAAERERSETLAAQARQDADKAAQERIEKLFSDLESPDYDTREKAGQQLAQTFKGNRLEQALKTAGRTEALLEIANAFKGVRDLDGVDDDGYQRLHQAKDPLELVKVAHELGARQAKSTADERIAELEAQLEEARGRRAATSLTPERSNGSNGTGARLSLEQYQRMSNRELRAAGITSADIDALTAEMVAEAQRSGR